VDCTLRAERITMIELSVPHVRNEVRAILKEFVFGEWRNIPYDVYYLSGDAKGRHEHHVGALSRQLRAMQSE
jgi:hypothetical protein